MVTENILMQKEKAFFLQVLADYLNKRKTAVPDNLNWQVLEIICQEHQLSGVIFHQCKNGIARSVLSAEAKTRWKREYIYNYLLYSKRLALLAQIDTAFQKENIPYLIFKGTELARFYPVPGQRTMSDSDLLVHEEDKQRACDALVRLGLEMNSLRSNEWIGDKDEMTIELHHKLIYDYRVEIDTLQTWGDKVWEHTFELKNKTQYKLDLTYHLVYTMLHLRKHLLAAGIGFRQFMDVALLASQPDINWQQAELWFRELNLEKFSQVCFAFCKKWFNIQLPNCKYVLEEEFYNQFTEKMFAGGVFGLYNEEATENIVFNEVRFAKSSSISGILRYGFLPYEKMRLLPYCEFLDGRPYLLPVAWCWRVIYRVGKVVPLLKGAYDKETIKKKEDMLTKWGL